jgi:hypothetical protein
LALPFQEGSVVRTPGREHIVIYVSKRQLEQVEYLISQSIQGNHILFDIETVRRVFWRGGLLRTESVTEEESYAVEHHIEKLILQPSLAQKKAYLEQLDSPTFEKVVRTYFNIVENNLYENQEVRH